MLDFLGRLLLDRSEGRSVALADYLRLYPGYEQTVAAEWLRAEAGAAPTDGRHGEAARAQDAAAADADAPGRAGRVGRFRLLREIGRGGQGAVWLAHDERLDRRVALKVVPASPLFRDIAPRLAREAQAASRLAHPGLCAVHDVGCDDGVAWIAMRHVEGVTLARRLQADAGAPPSRAEFDARLSVLEGVARALHVAHEAGIVHRDVKPGNIMIGTDGTPVLLDFGLALSDADGAPLTITGEAPGTPAYMAPECLRRGAARADRRADVWSLGVTLHEAVTGRRPFDGVTREELVRRILDDEPEDPRLRAPGLPRDLSAVVQTALAKEPERRYPSALALADELGRLRRGEPVAARRVSSLGRLLLWARRRRALASAIAVAVLALTGGLVASTLLLLQTRAALHENRALLDDYRQLSDRKQAADLQAEAEALWPALPERGDALAAWIAAADVLLGRLPGHVEALSASEDRARGQAARSASVADAYDEAWLAEQLAQLVAALQALSVTRADVERRLEFARTIEARSLAAPAADWAAAADAVARDPRFSGVTLAPQLGLLPLGADRVSGLQEFAHLASGPPAVRDPDTGRLALDDHTGVVLVLVPGGATRVGAAPPSSGAPPGSAHVDQQTGPWDGPVQSLRLDPFFIAKHELTQAQWRAHAGDNPSAYGPESKFTRDDQPLRHPVENVSWHDARRWLEQVDLALPTEAQWEHAARAGTTTPWWTGKDVASLAGAGNLADAWARDHGGHENWSYEAGHDDGAVMHAAVGRYRPNAWGLHDTIGNVQEWCADAWEDWSLVPPRDGDGLCAGTETAPVFRGGSYTKPAERARSACRDGLPPEARNHYLGLRPARALRP